MEIHLLSRHTVHWCLTPQHNKAYSLHIYYCLISWPLHCPHLLPNLSSLSLSIITHTKYWISQILREITFPDLTPQDLLWPWAGYPSGAPIIPLYTLTTAPTTLLRLITVKTTTLASLLSYSRLLTKKCHSSLFTEHQDPTWLLGPQEVLTERLRTPR